MPPHSKAKLLLFEDLLAWETKAKTRVFRRMEVKIRAAVF